MVEANAALDRAIEAGRAKSRASMARQKELSASAPVPNVLATGSPEAVRGHLVGLAGGDRVEVEDGGDHLAIRVFGERGRRQAVQVLLSFGVDAPTLELTAIETADPKWKMALRVPRPVLEGTRRTKLDVVEVPEPSFFSFSGGDALHDRAQQKLKELATLQRVIDELDGREAKQRAATAAVVDEASMERARRRRYFAIALLPDVTDGALTFAEDRATWKGATSFDTLEEAKAAFAGRASVLGYAPGKKGSLTAVLDGAAPTDSEPAPD